MTNQEKIDRVKELVTDARIGMFTTLSNNEMYSRPISIAKFDELNTLWFFTDMDSGKVAQLKANNHVNFSFSNIDDNEYVSINGKAVTVKDQAKIDELWSPIMKAWFPEGKESPNLVLIKVTPDSAEFWNSTSNSVMEGLYIAGALLTGKKYEKVEGGENETVEY